jgi:hypothetical protein
MEIMVIIARVLAFVLGLTIVLVTLVSMVRTFVLPRSDDVFLTRLIFQTVFRFFLLRLRWADSYAEQDRVMALFSPVALLMMPIVWLTTVSIGYMGMFWAFGVQPWYNAFLLSGSSLLTLGFAPVDGLAQTLLAFSEAALGLGLIALLIAYLPTMYNAFSRREAAVAMLEVRAGSPPSAVTMIERFFRIQGLERLTEQWTSWEIWFTELEESHTTFAPLVFFRSPKPEYSWITAAGAVLDAASLTNSILDVPHNPRADLCIRAGYLALRSIADSFRIPYNPDPAPNDPISITRQEFDDVYEGLARQGVPLKPDQDQAWRDFAGWRVNYDAVLLALATMTMAPYAPWSSDRGPLIRPTMFGRKRN